MSFAESRVLCVQSHVVHGYVGNKCAVFPMQLHGLEVDWINSVQFSNHTAYPYWKGQILNSDQLEELYDGLRVNNLHHYSHLLTGYVANKSFLNSIIQLVVNLRRTEPALFYICDPVLGDNDEYYVPEELMPVYRDELLCLADVVTPNQFELEQLSGFGKISSEMQLLEALNIMHNRRLSNIVVTSTSLAPVGSGKFWAYASTGQEKCRFEVDYLDAWFLGTGDLFTSLLLIWMSKTNKNLMESVKKVLATIQDILKVTLIEAKNQAGAGMQPGPKELELRLVQSKEFLLEPKSAVIAMNLNV